MASIVSARDTEPAIPHTIAGRERVRVLRWNYRRDSEQLECELSLTRDLSAYELRVYPPRFALSPASEYAALAVVLSSALTRTSEHPSIDAELAGEEWGHGLAQRRGAVPTTPESARDHAVELFDDFGFEPQRAPESPSLVRLTRCPLLEAARANPAIVCSVHLGMLRGVLDEYGANPKGSALVPFAEPGACRAVIPPVDDLS